MNKSNPFALRAPTYYAPWGNLALFYKDFDSSAGLIFLGRLDAGLEALAANAGQVRIERLA